MLLNRPTLLQESRLWQAGYRLVAGIDEAGRGALAGPVVAAAVILPVHSTTTSLWGEVGDSKLLAPALRLALAPRIQAAVVAWGIGVVPATAIDRLGIAPATRQAMVQAISALAPQPDYLLLDWVRLPQINVAQESFTKADRDIVSVAAASILAKVYRDQLLIELHATYPAYGFHEHKGYGTAAHLATIDRHGPCPEHRHTFAPMAKNPSPFAPVTPDRS